MLMCHDSRHIYICHFGDHKTKSRWPLRSLPATSPGHLQPGYGAELCPKTSLVALENRRGLGGYEAPRGLAFWVVWVAR